MNDLYETLYKDAQGDLCDLSYQIGKGLACVSFIQAELSNHPELKDSRLYRQIQNLINVINEMDKI